MSYAEHGSRIFFTGRDNSNPLLKYGEYIIPRKRSEARLKLFESCTDLRAWSPNSLDNFRYFREIVETRPPQQAKIVPYDVMIETLIQLGTQAQAELISLRQQLEKYKSLRLSPEQKKQLQDIDGYSLGDENEIEDSTSLQEPKSTDEEIAIPKRPGTPEHSTSNSSSIYESESVHRSMIDDDSSSEYRFQRNKRVASSKTDSDEYVDLSEGSCIRSDNENHQAIIIEKDSEIIALKNELGAKDVELEELKDLNRNLETMLKKKEVTLDSLRGNLKISQNQILTLGDELHGSMEESKKKLYSFECLVDHLKTSLAEKSVECNSYSREIEDLQKRIEETEIIRQERDCLGRTLDEMNDERNTLRELNQEQAMHLADQDDEINQLLGLLKLKTAEHSEREMKMKRMLDDLRTEIRIKQCEISRYEADSRVSSWKQLADSTSLSEMANLDLRKMRCALLEDVHEVENEIKRRCVEAQQKNCLKEDLTSSKKMWKRDKELMEYTNEQLKTMQVSDWRATNEEQEDDEIYERIVSQTSGSLEKIQQLIVELEPYQQERLTLTEKINYLNESLDEAQNRGDESRGVKDAREFDEYEKVIRLSKKTNTIEDSEKDDEEMRERGGCEKRTRTDEEELDEKIDEALVIHVKRSIERVERISLSLEGGGDSISREMARKEKELEARNEEIAKLRVQVASRVSRGQGDHATQQEHSNEMSRVKNELSTTQRSLQRTRDQLLSSDFKLKGANQRIKNLGIEINRLTKENTGLNNTVLITNDLAIKVDEMEIRLDSLQDENLELRQRVSRTNELCAEYQKKLIDLRDEGMQAKEAFERAESRLKSLLLGQDNKIVTLQEEKESAKRELEETKLKVATLTEQIQSLRMQNTNLDFLEALIKEILKLDKNAKRLRVNMEFLKSQLENQRRINDKIEEDLNLILGENVSLENETRQMYEYIERNSSNSMMPEAVAEQVLNTLSNKVLDHIEALKTRQNSSESVGLTFQSEINELRAKSLEDASVIENLRRDIDLWNSKAAEQEKVILVLEEANVELRRRLEEIQRDRETVDQESSPEISTEEIIAKVEHLEGEIREKDERIVKLAREIDATKEECKALSEKVESLTSEKTELSEAMRGENASWQSKMTALQQQYKQRVRALHDQHNVSVKRLEAQYEEDIKNHGNPFDPETWLRSLTIKEMTELHKRICKSTPCDASKITRALNDKQNQQLQEDEKLLHSDIVNLRTGHHKEMANVCPGYMYERRKFNKPTETPFEDNTTFDMQPINFIHQCAMEHKYDGGN